MRSRSNRRQGNQVAQLQVVAFNYKPLRKSPHKHHPIGIRKNKDNVPHLPRGTLCGPYTEKDVKSHMNWETKCFEAMVDVWHSAPQPEREPHNLALISLDPR